MTKPARIATFPSLPSLRFPRWIFNPLNNASLHYRSASACQYLLGKHSKFTATLSSERDSRYTYSTLISRNDRFLAYCSISSLLRTLTTVPSIAVGLDNDFPKDEACSFFSGLSAPSIKFYSREEISHWLESNSHSNLAWFSHNHIFGTKLGLNIMLSKYNQVLYADSDVLWFNDISKSEYFDLEVPSLAASIDSGFQPYDPVLMDSLSKRYKFSVKLTPHGCAGVCLFGKNPDLALELDVLIENIRTTFDINRLTEQTVVSAISKRDGYYLSTHFISMDSHTTVFSPSHSVSSCLGRHYPANFRPQFWIDAFYLLLATS